MSDIKVALSSTKHIVKMEGPEELTALIQEKDFPICTADMGMELYGWGKDLEREELHIAEMCKDMAKTVFVDLKTRYVFVGENPADPETGLIEYTDNVNGHCSDSFFQQWGLLNSMFLEFNVVSIKGPMFTLRGLWIIDSWKFLDIFTHANITVVTP